MVCLAAFFRLKYYPETLLVMAYAGVGLTERFSDYCELITFRAGLDAGHNAFHRLKRGNRAV